MHNTLHFHKELGFKSNINTQNITAGLYQYTHAEHFSSSQMRALTVDKNSRGIYVRTHRIFKIGCALHIISDFTALWHLSPSLPHPRCKTLVYSQHFIKLLLKINEPMNSCTLYLNILPNSNVLFEVALS